MKTDLLALDVDGTLLGPDQRIAPDTAEALRDAQRTGLAVCLATGRTLAETLPVWRELPLEPPFEPLVLIGGALVSEPDTGRTLCARTVDRETLCEYAAAVAEAGYTTLATIDPWRHELDYVIAPGDDYEHVERTWLGQMAVRTRVVEDFARRDVPLPVRLNSVVDRDEGDRLASDLSRRFDGRLNIHVIHAPNYDVTLLEAFSPRAHKASGVLYVAQGRRVPLSRVVAVGDDVNDVHMLEAAGLGVAMPHATAAAKRAADVVLAGSLAELIRDLSAGNEPRVRASGESRRQAVPAENRTG